MARLGEQAGAGSSPVAKLQLAYLRAWLVLADPTAGALELSAAAAGVRSWLEPPGVALNGNNGGQGQQQRESVDVAVAEGFQLVDAKADASGVEGERLVVLEPRWRTRMTDLAVALEEVAAAVMGAAPAVEGCEGSATAAAAAAAAAPVLELYDSPEGPRGAVVLEVAGVDQVGMSERQLSLCVSQWRLASTNEVLALLAARLTKTRLPCPLTQVILNAYDMDAELLFSVRPFDAILHPQQQKQQGARGDGGSGGLGKFALVRPSTSVKVDVKQVGFGAREQDEWMLRTTVVFVAPFGLQGCPGYLLDETFTFGAACPLHNATSKDGSQMNAKEDMQSSTTRTTHPHTHTPTLPAGPVHLLQWTPSSPHPAGNPRRRPAPPHRPVGHAGQQCTWRVRPGCSGPCQWRRCPGGASRRDAARGGGGRGCWGQCRRRRRRTRPAVQCHSVHVLPSGGGKGGARRGDGHPP